MLNNPYSDEWKTAAYDAAVDEFSLLCRREAASVFPNKTCDHPSSDWESCLEQGCEAAPIEQDILYQKVYQHYSSMVHESIVNHMVEPVDSYFGTSSCWTNAAIEGVRAVKIFAPEEMLKQDEVNKDRSIVVEERGGVFFLVTGDIPEGDKLFGSNLIDQEDSPHSSYLGVLRRDSKGWYRRVEPCETWFTSGCTGVGFEVHSDPIGRLSNESDYLCGHCQREAAEDR